MISVPKRVYSVQYRWYSGEKANISTIQIENATPSIDYGVLSFYEGNILVRAFALGEWISMNSEVREKRT